MKKAIDRRKKDKETGEDKWREEKRRKCELHFSRKEEKKTGGMQIGEERE